MTRKIFTNTYIRHILEIVEIRGASSEQLLLDSNVDISVLNDPLGRMTISEHRKIWSLLLKNVDFEDFILNINDILVPGAISMGVHSAMCADNLQEFFYIVSKLKNEIGGDQIELGIEGNEFYLGYNLDPVYGPIASYISAFLALHLILLIRWLISDDVTATRVFYKGMRKNYHRLLESKLGLVINFEQSNDRIYFDKSLFSIPLRTRNPWMKEILSLETQRVCDFHNPENNMHHQVKAHLDLALEQGDTSIKGVAEVVGLNVRTLQRRLNSEGYTFAQLLDETRKKNVLSLIKNTPLSVEKVMNIVGILDKKYFYQCFKRWTGMTPSKYRTS